MQCGGTHTNHTHNEKYRGVEQTSSCCLPCHWEMRKGSGADRQAAAACLVTGKPSPNLRHGRGLGAQPFTPYDMQVHYMYLTLDSLPIQTQIHKSLGQENQDATVKHNAPCSFLLLCIIIRLGLCIHFCLFSCPAKQKVEGQQAKLTH